jgi:hypothetical protein
MKYILHYLISPPSDVKRAKCRNSTMNDVSDKGINGEVEDKKGETESNPWMNVMSPFFTSALFLRERVHDTRVGEVKLLTILLYGDLCNW